MPLSIPDRKLPAETIAALMALPKPDPAATEPPPQMPAQRVEVKWHPVGWDGSKWQKDISSDCSVTGVAEGRWNISNNYKSWPNILALMDNVDIRQGAVEFEIKASGNACNFLLLTLGGWDGHLSSPYLKANTPHQVRIEMPEDGIFQASVDGQPVQLVNFNAPQDPFRPAIRIPAGAEVEIANVRQCIQKR